MKKTVPVHAKENSIVVDIATIRVELVFSSGDCSAFQAALERYRLFMAAPGARPHYGFDVAAVDCQGFLAEPDDTLSVSRSTGVTSISRDNFRAEFSESTGEGTLRITDNIFALDSFLRVFYSLMLIGRGGLLLHASGIKRNGKAYIFCGPSESGKTTAAGFAPAGGILSDELTAVRLTRGSVRAYGTPFMGEMGTGSAPVSASVAALFFLNRKGGVRNVPLQPSAVPPLLMGVVMNFDTDPGRVRTIFDTVIGIAGHATCRELCFDRSGGFWELVLNDD